MSGEWWRLTVRCEPAQSDAVASLLVHETGQGVEESAAGEIRSIAESEGEADRVLSVIRKQFPNAQGEISALAPVDWSVHWRDGIETHRFGRLVLSASWLKPDLSDGDVLVTIDPQSAFGSGEHGSTRVALQLLERHLKAGDRVLDFGSGSGVLAIAAARLGAASAIGIEVDEDAIPIAEENAAKNDVAARVTFLLGDADDLGRLAGPADVICSNILRSVNVLLLPTLKASLAPGGVVIFAGMETPEAELFKPVLAREGWRVVDEAIDSNWWGVAAVVA